MCVGVGRRVEGMFDEGVGGEGWRRGTCHVLSGLGHGSLLYLRE